MRVRGGRGPSRPVPSRHRALARAEGLRLKAPQCLGEAPGRRCVWRGVGKPGVAVRLRERLWDADAAAPGGLVSAVFPPTASPTQAQFLAACRSFPTETGKEL